MRKIICFFCICFFTYAVPVIAAKNVSIDAQIRSADDTANGIPAIPYKAVINQQNTHVYAQCMAKIFSLEGQKVLVIPFPQAAENVQLLLPTQQGKSQGKVLYWTIEKALPFKPQGSMEKQRVTLESMHDSLAGALSALRAQESAMLEGLKDKNASVNSANAKKLYPDLALVGTRIAATERQLAQAKKRIELFSTEIPASQQYVVRIETDLPTDTEVLVSYAYTLANTFWTPTYFINANTKDNSVNLELHARITQNSDLDWKNVELELTTAQGNERAPLPLNQWVVRKANANVVYAKRMPELMMARGAVNDAVATFDPNSTLASWHMPNIHQIQEGITILKLAQDKWEAPLMRIARPFVSGNKVWLSAKHKLINQFYPAGQATFLLDGVMTGEGSFAPKGDEVEVFFGADPLVTVQTKEESRKTAEQGLIGKEQTWQWSWLYSIENKRPNSVTVILEEPQTQAEDAAMQISYMDEPKPELGPENTFIWKMEVAADGIRTIKRSITLKAPGDMKLDLGR